MPRFVRWPVRPRRGTAACIPSLVRTLGHRDCLPKGCQELHDRLHRPVFVSLEVLVL